MSLTNLVKAPRPYRPPKQHLVAPKTQKVLLRWILRVIFLLIGVGVASLVYIYSLPFNEQNGVPPTQAALYSLIFAIAILSFWLGTLVVAIRLGKV